MPASEKSDWEIVLPPLILTEARHRFDENMLKALECELRAATAACLARTTERLRAFIPEEAAFTALELLRASYKQTKDGRVRYQQLLPDDRFDLSVGADRWFTRVHPISNPYAYIRAFGREKTVTELSRRTGFSRRDISRKLDAWGIKLRAKP